MARIILKKSRNPHVLPFVQETKKTSMELSMEVYQKAKARADRMGVDFQTLVEYALVRDLSQRMAILRTDDGIVYAPVFELPAVKLEKTDDDLLAAFGRLAEERKRKARSS